MNVVLHGILPLLTLTALLLAAVMPLVVASWMRRVMAVAGAGGRQLRLSRSGLAVIEQVTRWIPVDIAAANQAWRAPPTVRPQKQRGTSADSIGRRLG
jgi:hypothetical protein